MARSRMAREGRVGLLAVARASRCRGELAVRALAPALSSPGPLRLLGLASMRRTCHGTLGVNLMIWGGANDVGAVEAVTGRGVRHARACPEPCGGAHASGCSGQSCAQLMVVGLCVHPLCKASNPTSTPMR